MSESRTQNLFQLASVGWIGVSRMIKKRSKKIKLAINTIYKIRNMNI